MQKTNIIIFTAMGAWNLRYVSTVYKMMNYISSIFNGICTSCTWLLHCTNIQTVYISYNYVFQINCWPQKTVFITYAYWENYPLFPITHRFLYANKFFCFLFLWFTYPQLIKNSFKSNQSINKLILGQNVSASSTYSVDVCDVANFCFRYVCK
jgi:hypothetical protein